MHNSNVSGIVMVLFLTCLTFRIALTMLILTFFELLASTYLQGTVIHLIFLHLLGAENTS